MHDRELNLLVVIVSSSSISQPLVSSLTLRWILRVRWNPLMIQSIYSLGIVAIVCKMSTAFRADDTELVTTILEDNGLLAERAFCTSTRCGQPKGPRNGVLSLNLFCPHFWICSDWLKRKQWSNPEKLYQAIHLLRCPPIAMRRGRDFTTLATIVYSSLSTIYSKLV